LQTPEPLRAEFFCISCRTPFLNGFPLDSQGRCALCRRGVRGFDAAWCYGAYEGVLRELVHLYKYGRIQTLARPLADWLMEAIPGEEQFDLIAPVPLHWWRQWQRGFNQSELLAREVARARGVPMKNLLKRARSTRTQAGLSNTERRRNVVSAFGVRWGGYGGRRIQGKRVLLIDDVMTTGSTAASCALALKRAGAARVALLTVARVDRRLDVTRAAAAVSRAEVSSAEVFTVGEDS
jgi:ComF family protein